jgi:hypothetical protein
VGGNGKVLIDQSTTPLSGTNDWKNLAIVMDVPSDAILSRTGWPQGRGHGLSGWDLLWPGALGALTSGGFCSSIGRRHPVPAHADRS